MKLPNSRRNATRELERVVTKGLKIVESAETQAPNQETLERLLNSVILQISKHRRLNVNQVAKVTDQVIAAMPQEYGRLDEKQKSWEAFIVFLYLKYQMVLGVDISIFQ